MSDELKRYSGEGLHDVIVNWMSHASLGTVLDAPSGQGALSRDLEHRGYTVFLGDLAKDNVLYQNGRLSQFDIGAGWPFKNNSFDYIMCIEGIEHIENPHHVLRESFRVLRDGGYLVVTTPNIMTIKSRIRFLLYSYFDYFRNYGPVPKEEKHRIDDYDHQHVNAIPYGEMKYALTKCGFSLTVIKASRMVKRHSFWYPILKKLIIYKTKKRYADPFYISDTLLEGEVLAFIAKK
jgi:SAM-dependent methyltransferase